MVGRMLGVCGGGGGKRQGGPSDQQTKTKEVSWCGGQGVPWVRWAESWWDWA